MNELLLHGHDPKVALPAAEVFGRYHVIRTLAFGGMAQILLACDGRADRQVVLKRILPHFASDPEFVQFFIHEGRLGQRLRHPNICQTLEAGQVKDIPYIALEFLRGQPAIELLRTAARARVELPLGAAVRIVADTARGLHYAHMATDAEGNPLNVVHRDVTPHNLFICQDGTTKVLDFGIAKAASQLHHTRTGTIKGKFAYLAPEQIRGDEADRRVDVFALGIVLHELLTLRPLFRGSNDAETLQKVLTMEVPAPEAVRAGVPPGLGAVALRALQRDRERRLPSAEALADSIEAVALAEGIDTSREGVARLLAEICPPVEEPPLQQSPSNVTLLAPEPIEVIELSEEAAPAAAATRREPTDSVELIIGNLPSPNDSGSNAVLIGRGRAGRTVGRAMLAVSVGGLLVAAGFTSRSFLERVGVRAATPALLDVNAPRELAAPATPAVVPAQMQAKAISRSPAALTVPQTPPAEATLRVQTEGPASFTVDGHPQRAASDGALHLSPGHHRVVVASERFAFPRVLEVDLKPHEAALRAVRPGHGQLRVAVTPWAQVIIDGKDMGVTPLQAIDLSEGAHWVTLKNSELGATARHRVLVTPGKQALLRVDLFGNKH